MNELVDAMSPLKVNDGISSESGALVQEHDESKATTTIVSTAEPQVVLDYLSLPHIWDAIIETAPFESLFLIRKTSNDMHTRINRLLLSHIVVTNKVVSKTAGRIVPIETITQAESARHVEVVDLYTPPIQILDCRACIDCATEPHLCHQVYNPGCIVNAPHPMAVQEKVTGSLPNVRFLRLFDYESLLRNIKCAETAQKTIVVTDLTPWGDDCPVAWVPEPLSEDVVFHFLFPNDYLETVMAIPPVISICSHQSLSSGPKKWKRATIIFTQTNTGRSQMPRRANRRRFISLLSQLSMLVAMTLPTTEWTLVNWVVWGRLPVSYGPMRPYYVSTSPEEAKGIIMTRIRACFSSPHVPVKSADAERLVATIRWLTEEEYRASVGEKEWDLIVNP